MNIQLRVKAHLTIIALLIGMLLAWGSLPVVFGHPGDPDNIWTDGIPLICTSVFAPVHDVSGNPYDNKCLAAKDEVFETWNGFGHPIDPVALLEAVIQNVHDLNAKNGVINSLGKKLEAAGKTMVDMNTNNDQAVVNSLQAFINGVEAQSGVHLDPGDAADLIADAQGIIDILTGG